MPDRRVQAWVYRALLLALLCSTGLRVAQARPLFSTGSYPVDPRVNEARRLMREGRYVRARELADQIFASKPDSFESWYLMGLVTERSESNLPRAWYYLTGARKRLEAEYGGEDIPSNGPWRLHSQILMSMIDVAGQMERFHEQLRLISTINRLYTPTHPAWYAWPLMKLGHYRAARMRCEQALRDQPDNEDSVTQALNTLGAINGEQGHLERAYLDFVDLIRRVKQHGWSLDATYFYNAAEQAEELHRFGDEERLLLEGTHYFNPASYTNPWTFLSTLYIGSARFAEAINAVKQMHAWSHAAQPYLEQQRWNEEQDITASLLVPLGYDQDALQLVRRTLNRPDRRGGNSMNPVVTEIASLTFYRELLTLEGEREREELTWCTWPEWFRLQFQRLENAREKWSTSSRLAALIISHRRLAWALRPYGIDSRVIEWVRPILHKVLGDGVVCVEMKRLMARTGAVADRERPYLEAAIGEADEARGYPASAITNLTAAMKGLPEVEALLRARVTALLAECYEREGDSVRAMSCWREVMDRDPNVIRALGLAIPVTIENDGSATALIVARWLHASPRFNDVGGGFMIRVSTTPVGASVELLGPDSSVLNRTTVKARPNPTTTARKLCAAFYTKAFTPRIGLSQVDINSLDGSNEAGKASRHELLRAIGVPVAQPTPTPTPTPETP